MSNGGEQADGVKRRTVLTAVGTVTMGALAGCSNTATGNRETATDTTAAEQTTTDTTASDVDTTDEGTTQTPVSQTEPLTVEYTVSHTWYGEDSITIEGEGETITNTAECYDHSKDESAKYEETKEFSQMDKLRKLVNDTNPETWQDYYDCTGESCMTDLPSTTIRVTIGEESYETGHYTGRQKPLPDGLAELNTFLSSQLNRFPRCEGPESSSRSK